MFTLSYADRRLSRLILVLLIMMTGLGSAHGQDKIKVGFPMILSGPPAQFGAPILMGAQMYVDEINAKGGVLGKKIELIPRDTKSRPEEAVRVSRELILREQVNFLVGTFTSGEGPAVSEIAKESKVVFLALGPKTDRLTDPANLHPYVFRIAANTTTEGRAAAALMAKWKGKRVATVAPDFAYGRDAVAVFVKEIKKLRPDIEIVDQQWPKLNEADFSPFITAQLGAKPDMVFSVICCGNFSSFAKQGNALDYFKKINFNFLGVGEAAAYESLKSLGKEYPIGVWGNAADAFNFVPKDPAVAKIHADFSSRVKAHSKEEYPPSWTVTGYIGMHFLVEAIKKANSLDALKVSGALKGLELMTPMGSMTMRAKDQQLTRGLVWGQAAFKKEYPFPVLDPIEYIDPKPLMD
jgi:branched-chain amino acid transport system substrate-binding protein